MKVIKCHPGDVRAFTHSPFTLFPFRRLTRRLKQLFRSHCGAYCFEQRMHKVFEPVCRSISAGPRRRTKWLFAERAPLPAVLPEPGRLLLGSPALPHSGLGLPASVLPTSLPAVVPAVLPEPGLGLFPPVGPLPLHQLHPPAPAGGMALTEVALRGRGPPVTVASGAEPRSPAGVPGCPSAAARSRGRRRGARGRSPRDAPGTPRPGGPAGHYINSFIAVVALFGGMFTGVN